MFATTQLVPVFCPFRLLVGFLIDLCFISVAARLEVRVSGFFDFLWVVADVWRYLFTFKTLGENVSM